MGEKFKEWDSFIVDVNKFLSEPTSLPMIDRAFNLLRHVCDNARMNETELMDRLETELADKKEQRELTAQEVEAKGSIDTKAALEELLESKKETEAVPIETRYNIM